MSHTFHIAKQEEKELLIIGSLSKENNYPIAEINSTSSKWCPINLKSHNTNEC